MSLGSLVCLVTEAIEIRMILTMRYFMSNISISYNKFHSSYVDCHLIKVVSFVVCIYFYIRVVIVSVARAVYAVSDVYTTIGNL